MAKICVLKLKETDILKASDMLRYDGAFKAKKLADGDWEIETAKFTPERWKSFMTYPVLVTETQVTNREWTECITVSSGFVAGFKMTSELAKNESFTAYVG